MNHDTTNPATINDPVARAEEAYNRLLEQLRALHPDSRRLIDKLDDAVADLVASCEMVDGEWMERIEVDERLDRVEAGAAELRKEMGELLQEIRESGLFNDGAGEQ